MRPVKGLWAERRWILAIGALFTFTRLPNVGGWDEAFYVGQLVSVVGDGDLRLQDDVVLVPQSLAEKHRILTTTQPSGALANTMGIGPAILLSPFTAPTLWRAHPPPWTAFRWGATVAALMLMLATAALSVDALRRLGLPDRQAALATGLATIGGPLAVYGTRSHLHSHAWSAFLVALTLQQALVFVSSRRRAAALGLGLAAGLACIGRWQDVVVVAPLVVAALALAAAPKPALPSTATGRLALAGLAFAGAALAIACQLVAWQKQFGSALLVPQGSGYMRWLEPRVVPLLLSSHGGLLPWAPGLALGLLGLAWLLIDRARRPEGGPARARWIVAAMLVSTAAAVYVSACPEDWWGRETFGPRRLTALTPFAAAGLAHLLSRSGPKTRAALSAAVVLAGVCLVSAHFSGHRDLALLLFDRADPWSPDPTQAPPAARWMDRWGPLHFAKPGLTFTDSPTWGHRLLGLAAVALVAFTARGLWRGLHRSRALQRAAVAAGTALVASWLVALALAPNNASTNTAWRSFLERPLDAGSGALPSDMSAAREIVMAKAAAAAGGRDAQARELR